MKQQIARWNQGFFERRPNAIACGSKTLDLTTPQVMGIINTAPNSFCATSRIDSPQQALDRAEQMIADGAAIIDVGGEPTNPSLNSVTSLQQELDRIAPILEILGKSLTVPISIDTSKPAVMQEAVKLGAGLINDVRALREEGALQTAANLGVGVCLMHMAYPHGKEQNHAPAAVSIAEIKKFLIERVTACAEAGIIKEKIIIDPGIGHGNFGKNQQQNLAILAGQQQFLELDLPLLIGVSRKTFIGNILNASEENRVYGSIAAAVIAIANGAAIIRTHDVKATVDALQVANVILRASTI